MFSWFGCFPLDRRGLYISTDASSHRTKGPVTAEAAEPWFLAFDFYRVISQSHCKLNLLLQKHTQISAHLVS